MLFNFEENHQKPYNINPLLLAITERNFGGSVAKNFVAVKKHQLYLLGNPRVLAYVPVDLCKGMYKFTVGRVSHAARRNRGSPTKSVIFAALSRSLFFLSRLARRRHRSLVSVSPTSVCPRRNKRKLEARKKGERA